ncbi:hypothetical protein D3C75_790930 [compost metagenome]
MVCCSVYVTPSKVNLLLLLVYVTPSSLNSASEPATVAVSERFNLFKTFDPVPSSISIADAAPEPFDVITTRLPSSSKDMLTPAPELLTLLIKLDKVSVVSKLISTSLILKLVPVIPSDPSVVVLASIVPVEIALLL